ncbi:MAG: transporter substrate-binding domain-containing protein [Chlorobiaceae bacterium]|nr:transporter substrate-binding domain-containing protein [Chlorobiaceae bacterium]
MTSTIARFMLLTILSLLIMVSGCGGRPHAIEKMDDARYAKIGIMTGTTGEIIAKNRFPQAELKHFDDVMDAFMALKSGKIDGIVTTYLTANQLCKKNPDVHFLSEDLIKESVSVAVRKGNTELLHAADTLIGELEADGTIADMRKRWYDNTTGDYREPQYALPESGEPLRIGVSATREPMSFVDKNGRVTGFDGELARRFAAKLKRPVTFHDMKFMALIPALESGKIDAVITGISETEERKKRVDFSRPYFYMAQVLLVKRAGSSSK